MSLLLSNWPLRWRWARELCGVCKTWLWVTRTWVTIVLALAVPAALARERPPENRPAPRQARVQFAAVIDGVATPPRQHRPEPHPKECRQNDEWTTLSR